MISVRFMILDCANLGRYVSLLIFNVASRVRLTQTT